MGFRNINEHDAAAVQADLRATILNLRPQRAITLTSLKSGKGARQENGKLAGLEIPFAVNVPMGSSALDPVGGQTSFLNYVPSATGKMYAGLAFLGFTVEFEHFHDLDAERGNLPESRLEQRDKAMQTYYQERNWDAVGEGDGRLAIVTVGVASPGGAITLAYDNTARGRSKGSVRLAITRNTATNKRVMYQSYNTSGTKTAEFYITAKSSATNATVVITDGGTIGANDRIVKYGHFNKVPYGLGYFASNANRWFQGALTSDHPFLKATRIDGGGGPPTPTLIDGMKMSAQVISNDKMAANRRVFHLTFPNYRTLAAFGYELRQEKGDAMETYGLPQYYTDGDSDFIDDMDFEDCEIHMRDLKSFFLYRQSELREITSGPAQYVGTSLVGSTEKYQNWGEAYNCVWDGRGDDGKGAGGSANSFVYADNLEMPVKTQVAAGLSLV